MVDRKNSFELVGIGLYTPAEAQRLLGVRASRISRWLRGHSANEKYYPPLWKPQIDLQDGSTYLGFRDLMELRTADQFMKAGVSPRQIRRAILEARTLIDDERPLSTRNFKTDGRTIFLEVANADNDYKLLDLFKKQYAFSAIVKRSLKDVEFDAIAPSRWWVGSKKQGILVDPERAFGQPIEIETGIPASVLAAAARAENGIESAAKAWSVPPASVRRAVNFERSALDVAA